MRNVVNGPWALDLAILDRAYTPAAHWLYDALGLRAYVVGRAFLVGLPVAVVLGGTSAFDVSIGFLAAATVIVMLYCGAAPPKVGTMNPRRLSDQANRVFWFWWMLSWAWIHAGHPRDEFHSDLFWSCALSAFWFSAVTERPRQTRRKVAGSLAGQRT